MSDKKACHKTSIGGQALIEGVMMRGPEKCSLSVRLPNGQIDTETFPVTSVKDGRWYLKVPIVRGCVNFVESMVLGVKCLYKSADKATQGLEEEDEEPSRFEAALTKLFGDKLMNVVVGIGIVLGVVLAIGLFMFLPMLLIKLLENAVALGPFKTLLEGLLKISLFIGYLALVTRMKDIQRVFEYHGAEHKTIACYEAGEELTPENVKKFRRFHPRCGTSFLLIILILSILIFSVVTWNNIWIRFGLKILLLPIVVGIGYELIKLTGRYDNIVTRIVSAPGLWLQRLTTREPDESQMEVAIASIEAVLTGNPEDDKW